MCRRRARCPLIRSSAGSRHYLSLGGMSKHISPGKLWDHQEASTASIRAPLGLRLILKLWEVRKSQYAVAKMPCLSSLIQIWDSPQFSPVSFVSCTHIPRPYSFRWVYTMIRACNDRDIKIGEDNIVSVSAHNMIPTLQPPSSGPSDFSREIEPVPIVAFRGSFTPNKRQKTLQVPAKVGTARSIYLVFADGWQDVIIYKSAVCCRQPLRYTSFGLFLRRSEADMLDSLSR